MDFVRETVKRSGYFFYVMDPREHNYKEIDDVKDYYKEVIPLIFVTILMEQVIRYYQNKSLFKINDTISNACHGILMQLSKIPLKGIEIWVYAWIYSNYRLVTLPWDSPWTWILGWFVADFCHYWMHRMIHQVNILWTIHETHHTPDEMMFSAPMRNHIFMLPAHWLTSLPMALAVPPTVFLVHYQIGFIYQYWCHSEIIGKLPPIIEYIFITPSHHRVHHGRNRSYIDKNFGAFLIIWDRMFGTYEEEEVKPVYGITKPIKSFNPLVIQVSPFINIFKRFREADGIKNKLSVIFKGPGWTPGTPWTGNLEDIPDPAPQFEKFSPVLPKWLHCYVMIHFLIFLYGYIPFAMTISIFPKAAMYAGATFFAYSCIAFGFILDMSSYAVPAEIFRCLLYFATEELIYPELSRFGSAVVISMLITRFVFFGSLSLWGIKILTDAVRRNKAKSV